MINYANYLIECSILEPPFCFNIMLGNISSAQADLLHVSTIIAALPPQSIWNLVGFGAHQLSMNTIAITMGSGIRIGLEDNICFDQARTQAATNRALVRRAIEIAAIHERPAMLALEFRQILQLSPPPG